VRIASSIEALSERATPEHPMYCRDSCAEIVAVIEVQQNESGTCRSPYEKTGHSNALHYLGSAAE
jgi:hypothetical protein